VSTDEYFWTWGDVSLRLDPHAGITVIVKCVKRVKCVKCVTGMTGMTGVTGVTGVTGAIDTRQ